MSKLLNANKKIEEAVVGAYKATENAAVGGYKAIENAVVGGYKKIEDKFVETFLVGDEKSATEGEEATMGVKP